MNDLFLFEKFSDINRYHPVNRLNVTINKVGKSVDIS